MPGGATLWKRTSCSRCEYRFVCYVCFKLLVSSRWFQIDIGLVDEANLQQVLQYKRGVWLYAAFLLLMIYAGSCLPCKLPAYCAPACVPKTVLQPWVGLFVLLHLNHEAVCRLAGDAWPE